MKRFVFYMLLLSLISSIISIKLQSESQSEAQWVARRGRVGAIGHRRWGVGYPRLGVGRGIIYRRPRWGVGRGLGYPRWRVGAAYPRVWWRRNRWWVSRPRVGAIYHANRPIVLGSRYIPQRRVWRVGRPLVTRSEICL